MRVAIVGGTGPFGRAVATRLREAGIEAVVGSRDRDRAHAVAAELGVGGDENTAAVSGADLVVLAVNAEAAVETARELRAAIGTTPVLCVASELRFTKAGVLPCSDARSLAERVQDELDAPLVAGLHSLAASTLAGADAPHEDAFVCGDDADAKALALDLADALVAGRALDVGPLASARALEEGDDLAALLVDASRRGPGVEPGDVLVVAQKAVSKVEGRVVDLRDVAPSARALELAGPADPRRIEVILREAREVVRARPPLVIAETRHGFVCASAGVDASNAKGADTLVLLPVDPDASAERLRARIRELTGADVAVVVSDSFGRAWRRGTTDVALGVAGMAPLLDLRGELDAAGYELHATEIAVADEIAGAAQLVMGKTDGIPAAVVRGLDPRGAGTGRDLVMPRERDLFR